MTHRRPKYFLTAASDAIFPRCKVADKHNVHRTVDRHQRSFTDLRVESGIEERQRPEIETPRTAVSKLLGHIKIPAVGGTVIEHMVVGMKISKVPIIRSHGAIRQS